MQLLTVVCLASACDQQLDDTAETSLGDEDVAPEAFAGGASAMTNHDPWLDTLDHSSLEEIEHGFRLLAHDDQGLIIGEISIIQTSSDTMSINHEYPKTCDGGSTSSVCADTLRVSLNLTDQQSDVYTSEESSIFTERATAIINSLGPTEGKIRCALTILAASGTCVIVSGAGPIGIPPCAAYLVSIACACPEGFKKAWPDVDWDEFCD